MSRSTPPPALRATSPASGEAGLMNSFKHLYVHIPFCKHKCGYCDFNAYAGMDRLMPDYIDALERELARARERHPFEQLDTVYLGGGTPSLLPAELATRLLQFISANFDVAPAAEITLEANPASTDERKLDAWLAGGVNRLSLGVQDSTATPSPSWKDGRTQRRRRRPSSLRAKRAWATSAST